MFSALPLTASIHGFQTVEIPVRLRLQFIQDLLMNPVPLLQLIINSFQLLFQPSPFIFLGALQKLFDIVQIAAVVEVVHNKQR